LRREDRSAELPAPQLSALSVVVFRGPLTLGALAEAEQVRPPTMTRVVTALEQAGLVQRRTAETDRRVVVVQATPRGTSVLAEGRLRRVEALAHALGELPERDVRQLSAALDVLEGLVGVRSGGALARSRK
jgi:DNA-binding MarR family transcriptional regulator